MAEFLIAEVLNKRFEVLFVRGNEDSYAKIGILLRAQSEIVSFC